TARETAKSAASRRTHARMPIAIVGRALVRVAQHLVGFARFLKLFFRGMIARIPVRVIFHRLLAVGALQFLVARFTRNSQYLVVICFAHSCTQTCPNAFPYSVR